MQRMWLWVLLYAIGAGSILLVSGFLTPLGLGEIRPSTIASDIVGGIGCGLAFFAALVGFWILFAGMILLLNRSKFAKGRKISLIGIWFYFVGAFGIALAGSVFWFYCDFSPGCLSILLYYVIAAVVILPGFFIMRKLRRLQEAERGEP
jgi:drug/metabolite transporter (DMT)-like permease